jgi:hypothetical protein
LNRGVTDGAFIIDDVEIAVTFIVTGALGVIRQILDGDAGPQADAPLARMVLLGFGIDPAEATRLASLPLPRSSAEPTVAAAGRHRAP